MNTGHERALRESAKRAPWVKRHRGLILFILFGVAIAAYPILMFVSLGRQWVPFPEEKLEALTPSMTRDDVIARLGTPTKTDMEDGKETFLYKRWWSWGFALVYFDEAGHFSAFHQDDF